MKSCHACIYQISPVAPLFLPFVLIVTFCISFTNLIFLYEMKNQFLHFKGSSQINHSLPTTCQSGLKDGSIADHPANSSSLCCPSFILGGRRLLTDAVKPPLLSFISLTVKTPSTTLHIRLIKKKRYCLPSYACGWSAPASCLAVCNLNGKSYAMHEPTRLIHLVTVKTAQMKISYVLALTSFGVLDGSARSEQLAEIHLGDISLIH